MIRTNLTDQQRVLLQEFIDTDQHQANNGHHYSNLINLILKSGSYNSTNKEILNELREIYIKNKDNT